MLRREDKLVNGSEIKKRDSICKGSRCETKIVADEETRQVKVDVKHKTCTRKSSPRSCTACCSSDPENPHNDEHRGEHYEEFKLCKLEVPRVRDVTSADAHHGKVPGHDLFEQHGLKEDVIQEKIDSADKLMVLSVKMP